MKTGFTLIELLVVVLIIGILAAIALPQYQKAVERSRIAEAIQVLGDWANAQSIYYMQHNTFTEDINDGDITLPAPGNAFEYEIDDRNLNISAALSAIRASGIYEGGELMIRVSRDGSIEKICNEPRETTGFCPMAQAAGYLPEGNNSGGIGNLGGDAIIGPCPPGSSGGNCLSW